MTYWSDENLSKFFPYIFTEESDDFSWFKSFTYSWKHDSSLDTWTRNLSKKLSHAGAGETWLQKCLAQKGRTEADLAAVLWEKNWTAVAELCDDSFEEHVLAYPPEMTGLHLHGLNESTEAFKTQPHAVVDAFADEWGFIKTASMELPTIAAVRESPPRWGRQARGTAFPPRALPSARKSVPRPLCPRRAPYPPGAPFFKVKFDEPYMYRDWHEVTKMLLSMRCKAKGKGKDGMIYARWVIEEIRRDPAAFAEYSENKGIVAVRERFLAYLASEKGKKALKPAPSEKEQKTPEKTQATSFMKTIIVPDLTACSQAKPRTAVAVALSRLFGFGHTQSDDVKAKKPAPVFIKNVTELLKKHDVVIVDKSVTFLLSSSSPSLYLPLTWDRSRVRCARRDASRWRALESGDGDVAATEAFGARCKALSDMGRATVFRMRLACSAERAGYGGDGG
ncbi:RNA ligase-domain-containing protein [Mycena sanguinolenta]|nr:RNA ligase-domain-containing protein [Mycena sanguinolenta]